MTEPTRLIRRPSGGGPRSDVVLDAAAGQGTIRPSYRRPAAPDPTGSPAVARGSGRRAGRLPAVVAPSDLPVTRAAPTARADRAEHLEHIEWTP